MLDGSGGTALRVALTLCEAVDVFGVGLFSGSAGADKVYVHAYDQRVGQCLEPGEQPYRFVNK